MSWLALTEYLANGFVMGMLYVLMALGLSLIFGMIGVINFCHGILFTLGAYATVSLTNSLGFWPALVISPMLVGALGMLIEVGFLRRLYRADPSAGLLLTFGLAMVLEQLVRIIWGTSGLPYNIPEALTGALPLGVFVYPKYRHFILVCAIAIIAGLWLFLEKTPYGMIIRAGSRDGEMVRILGISLRPIFTFVFGLGSALAAIAGVLMAPVAGVQPAMGTDVGTAAFVVVTIGGLGSFWGVVIAGLLVGEVVSLSILFWPPIAQASMYILMAVVLLTRPRGLLGERWEKFE
jgi:branched-chain amino acid transport system permease protein